MSVSFANPARERAVAARTTSYRLSRPARLCRSKSKANCANAPASHVPGAMLGLLTRQHPFTCCDPPIDGAGGVIGTTA